MSTLDQRADRHLRADPQGILATAVPPTTAVVRITVGTELADNYAGQLAAWLLTNLLARQFKLVGLIQIGAPDVQTHCVGPFGVGANLTETLKSCVRVISGDLVKVEAAGASEQTPTIEVCVGAAVAPTSRAAFCLFIHADGWRYFVGSSPLALPPSQSTVPFGPYLAACFAAGEVFKRLKGLVEGKGEFLGTIYASAWTLTTEPSWERLESGPEIAGTQLPHFYLVGAGAVAHALALALGASGVRGSVTVIDYDKLDDTNANRYVLARDDDEGKEKVELLKTYFESSDLQCQSFSGKWQDFVREAGRSTDNMERKAREAAYRYDYVVSCVDKNTARHAIQNVVPRLVVGGSTDGLVAKYFRFDLSAEQACLKCFNPPEQHANRLAEIVAAATPMSTEQRREYASSLEIGLDDLQRLLSAGCGELSEADAERFGGGRPDMSVGFVSAAAGIMVAASMVRDALSDCGGSENGAWATFARPMLRWLRIGPDSSCSCAEKRAQWKRLWGSE